MFLPLLPQTKLPSLRNCPAILRQHDITRRPHNRLGQRSQVQCLLIKQRIPDAGRAILRHSSALRIDIELLAGRVCAPQNDEFVWPGGFRLEEFDQGVGGAVHAWEQTVNIDARSFCGR